MNMINKVSLQAISVQIETEMPWINGIESKEQYDELMGLMDSLVEDYEGNKTLINLLFPIIEHYEEESELFAEFNEHIESLDKGVTMLNLIIDQHQLTLSDLPEIGGKSLVSQILSGKKSITLSHIKALSSRFGIPAYMFL